MHELARLLGQNERNISVRDLASLEEALKELPIVLHESFITPLFRRLEARFGALTESLYEYWQKSCNAGSEQRRCYLVEGKWIVVYCQSELVREGETGLTVWPAAVALIDHLDLLKEEHSRIVELGCGVGLVGKVLSEVLGLKNILLTDNQNVLNITRLNYSGALCPFDWTLEHNFIKEDDFILGTDLLYDLEVIDALADIFNRSSGALLVQQIRNPETWQTFLERISVPYEIRTFKETPFYPQMQVILKRK